MIEFDPAGESAWLLCWLKRTQSSSIAAVAGGSQLHRKEPGEVSCSWGRPKSRRLSLPEGRRGAQERNCISSSFNSFCLFICFSFQGGSQFLKSIPVSARRRIR